MNREEVIEEILGLYFVTDKEDPRLHYVDVNKVCEIVEKIYRSRVCKNCFYYHEDGVCCCDKSPLVTEGVDENYGCVYFERREDERN